MLTPAKGLTYDAVPHAHMVTTAEQVARAVLQNSPFVRCFRCLSAQVGMLEKDAREAAQVLIVRDQFFVDRRVCQVCGHTDEMLVSGKAP